MEPDAAPSPHTKHALTIGLYTPYLQGFYIGELVNQIRQLCYVKGYHLVIIRTGGYGRFQSALELDQLDCAIFIRNAVSAEFAEVILQAGKPCVSIAYDYFPLSIPVVSSDNQFGIDLAMDYLLQEGHRNIAFVGDLSQYDLRKRYEHYCEAHDKYHLSLNEDYLFAVNDTQFSGGRAAAQRFVDTKCDATGIIFGAGLTGIGFLQYIKKVSPGLAETVRSVCFDAVSLIPVLTPELVSIDQNLHLIAYRVLNTLENQLAQKPVADQILIEPKLTRVNDAGAANFDAFIATCVDLPDFHNPNYVKALLTNMHEWPREIADSGLDQIMSIAPLFERFMGAAFLSRHFVDNNQKAWVKQIKAFLPGGVVKTDLSDSSSLCREEKFPPLSMRQTLTSLHDFQLHLPIQLHGKVWGFFSSIGQSSAATDAASFFAFGGYVESVVRLFEQDLEIKSLQKKLSHDKAAGNSAELLADKEAIITWNFEDGLTTWSEKALQKLGFQTAMELNIYSNMDITDRIHKDDVPQIRQCVAQSKSDKAGFQTYIRYKLKNGQFADAVLTAEPTVDSDQKITGLLFFLGVHHAL